MTLAQERHDPLAVLDAVITDMRASGDTGHVENLLQARADIAELIAAVQDQLRWLDEPDQGKFDLGPTFLQKADRRVRSAMELIGCLPVDDDGEQSP